MDKNIRPGIGKRIREVRKRKGLTLEQLAEKIGTNMSKTRLSDYENDNRALELYTLASIAEALETTIDYLYYGKGPKKATYLMPKKKDIIIRSLARLIDHEILKEYEGSIYYGDLKNEPLKHFISEYSRRRNSYSQHKEKDLRYLEEMALEELTFNEMDSISKDDVLTASRNALEYLIFKELKETKQ